MDVVLISQNVLVFEQRRVAAKDAAERLTDSWSRGWSEKYCSCQALEELDNPSLLVSSGFVSCKL